MKKEEMLEVIKGTKAGKWGLAFLILAVIALFAGEGANKILLCLIFIIIAAVFLVIGKNKLENSFSEGRAAPESGTNAAVSFCPTKKVGNYFWVDDTNKKWCIPQGKLKKTVYAYTDIMDYELIEDGNSITKGGLGRAVAGGILFGGLGAVVGGVTGGKKTKATCSKLQIKINVKNINAPVLYIDLITTETKKETPIYKAAIESAQEIIAVLQIMCSEVEAN